MAEKVCKESMKRAAAESVVLNDGSTDIAVALDGSWQKRGFTSLNGLLTATSFYTGKVLDVSVLSEYCRCPGKTSNIHDEKCYANFQGVSGAMELDGAKEIYRRSVQLHGIRYVKYLGDGDSKAYNAVVSDEPYGNGVDIEKLECVGHIQKRMGTQLRKLNATFRDDVEKMGRAVWAIFKHLESSNECPDHSFCDISWCKYSQDPEAYDHNQHSHSPRCLMKELRAIFEDLTDTGLLRECLHGETQNPNKCANHLIWTKLPKTVFVSLPELRTGVHIAVS
ncbi:uncharacterized protein LOC100901629 [Galendromus occidentalis]|uniref:Uncharacterized protein LOC100901629 n=1 Tax=Galendromus occidentalis TaxID=34638 RepID=A0AAJ7WGZ5_9ACAR|nr:uncharacterized protein LOC100901629 [Galendromus occidentalis]